MKGVPINVPIVGQQHAQQKQQINIVQMLLEGLGQTIMRLDRIIMLLEAHLPEEEKTIRLVTPETAKDQPPPASSAADPS